MKRKVICIILMVCLLSTSVSFYVTASETNDKAEIIELLQMVEPYKEEVGLKDVEFTLLEIGYAISVYDYVNEQFVFSRNAYPLFCNDRLVAIVYEVSDTTFQIMSQITESIKGMDVKEIAIVYDRQGCHVYDGDEFVLILDAESEDSSKDIISENSNSNIAITDLTVHTTLGYISRSQSRVQMSWMCAVSHVSQLPYKNICWAATVACITNYLMGTSYTATEIAQSYWKSTTDFDRGLERRFALETLNEYLDGTAFYTGAEEELDNYILGSLMQRYPVMGAFYSESNGHLVTIYRYSMENYGIIWIMDPLHNNPVMIKKNEVTYKYTYVGSSSNSVYTLQCVCGEFME